VDRGKTGLVNEHAVVIAGGGPTGLMLAGELALAGIDAVIVERRASQDLDGSRAGGLHSRTIEVLDQRGIADRFLSEGQVAQVVLDISDFPTRHNYGLALWQSHFERILAGWVAELGVPVLRGREVVAFAPDDNGVDVELAGGDPSLRAEYLVGCDGGRSVIRKAAGIEFPGLDPSTSWMIAEVEMDEEPETGVRPEGADGERDITRAAARHLPRRTASDRCASVALHDGAGRARHPRRPSPGPTRHDERTPEHGRAASAHRGDALRSRHPLRPR
jgi:2-polyprenyl-6-methoxyphenol hydroxylase-like FAD-dependent oxidoreductase